MIEALAKGRLLVVDTITWKPHIETGMELALRYKEIGGSVTYCNMRPGLPICEDSRPSHLVFDLPAIRINRGRALLQREGVPFQFVSYSYKDRKAAKEWAAEVLSGCSDAKDISALRYEAFFDLGWGVLSSAISMAKTAEISPLDHRRVLIDLLAAARLVYDQAQKLIESERPDTVALFNGRFATTRAVMRACEKEGVRWLIHERGCDREHFAVMDCFAHEPECFHRLVEAHCEVHGTAAGHDFFQQRRGRKERAWHSFVKHQEHGRLPEAVSAGGEWVTFFTSSEDELAAIGDTVVDPRYPTQMDAIECLSEAVGQIPGLRLCIRVHPHVAQKNSSDRRRWEELQIPGVLVVGPAEKVDSYALLDRSKVVASYGSTMGVEATYWGRPSLLFGRALYDSLDACEQAKDLEQVIAFLRSPRVFPRENAMRYGSFSQSFGERYRYYQAEGLHQGSILGVDLNDSPWLRLGKGLDSLAIRLKQRVRGNPG